MYTGVIVVSTHAHEKYKYFVHKTGMALPRKAEKITWKGRLRTQKHELPIQGMYTVIGYAEIKMMWK